MDIAEIREKVLKALDLENNTEFSDEDLCKMLNKKRVKFHSDKTQDEDFKEDFDKKFIEYQELYKEFTKAKLKDTEKSTAISLISNNLDYYQTKSENIELEEIVTDLKSKNESKDKIIEDLENSIKIVSRESILAERESLVNTLKPKRRDFLGTLGITAALTIGINILSKFERISSILKETFMISANYILLSVFVVICLIYVYNLLRESIIKSMSLEVCSAKFTRDFGKEKHSSFSESEVFSHIEKAFNYRKGIKNWIFKSLFRIYDNKTLEVLKQIFIFELLSKKLIRIGHVYCLEQNYLIIRQTYDKKENGEVFIKEW